MWNDLPQIVRSILKVVGTTVAPILLIIFDLDITDGIEMIEGWLLALWTAIGAAITGATEFWDWFQGNILRRGNETE